MSPPPPAWEYDRDRGAEDQVVNHAVEYVSGRVHTNGIENFWALFKCGFKGTYVCPQPFHLFRYLDERASTFTERDRDDLGRICSVLSRVGGRRITYRKLMGNGAIC
jgi:hypothetical protein